MSAAALTALWPWLTGVIPGSAAAGNWVMPAIWSAGLVGGLMGLVLSLLLVRRSGHGIERPYILEQAGRLVRDESMLILRAATPELRPIAAILEHSTDPPPAVFLIQAEIPAAAFFDTAQLDTPARAVALEALNCENLQEQACQLAEQHRNATPSLRNPRLLRRLSRTRRRVQEMCRDFSAAAAIHAGLPPAVEWLLDNEYILESSARDVQQHLPPSFYRQLPILTGPADGSEPRVFELARDLALHCELRLDEEMIRSYLEAYQAVLPLTIGEIWALPQMLRMVLIGNIEELAMRACEDLRDQEVAAYWADRLVTVHRREPERFYAVMAELTAGRSQPSSYFILKLIDYLHDEGAVLVAAQDWLVRSFRQSPGELILRVRNRQTRDRVIIGNAFTSLRQLALLNWNECFEEHSHVEQILCRDPAGIYPRMDFDTRNRYRRVIEELRQGGALEETAIAEQAVALAAQINPRSPGSEDESTPASPMAVADTAAGAPHPSAAGADTGEGHVGEFLIGPRRVELARQIGHRERLGYFLRQAACRHHTLVYFLGLMAAFSVIAGVVWWAAVPMPTAGQAWLIVALMVWPVGQIAVSLVNTLTVRLFTPRTLPKMDYSDTGIPDACRTLIVVPMLLTDSKTILAQAEKLEIRYLANPDPNLVFGLFSDFVDADQAVCESDEALQQQAVAAIEALNRRYAGERFFLFHRKRQWCASEQKYIGWERKRGKLEELNDLLTGNRSADADRLVYVGDPNNLTDLRYVITLDSDTQLPTGTARRLIETISHPLNRVQFDAAGRPVSGYTIVQPRVRPGLASISGSPFARLFGNMSGIDPYPTPASDVYQDLTGEGSYHGKGIYDVRTFSRILSGCFPEAHLLSHDLIEGAHVRVGLASDIELYDEFPQDYFSYCRRQHRWIRGDWQIADWILPWAPQAGGGYRGNPLTWFNRWKIFDNLRRSLLPAANLAVLIGGWMFSWQAGVVASILVMIQFCFHGLIEPVLLAISRANWKDLAWQQVARDLLRAVAEMAMLPFQAWLALDAIGRVIYRQTISHRGLLEWISAEAAQDNNHKKWPRFVRQLGLATLFSLAMAVALFVVQPTALWLAAPWLALWAAAPVVGWLLCRLPVVQSPDRAITAEDRRYLQSIARRTWRYFDDFVNAKNHWLPPDNYQVGHGRGLALRTSPTNIGMYLVSLLGAQRFGYLTGDGMVQRLVGTIDTLDRLERYQGHLLNWYDIRTLAPLEPRYVSMVDSGNLLGALWTLDQGLLDLTRQPVLDARLVNGLSDTLRQLRLAVVEEPDSQVDLQSVENLLGDLTAAPPPALAPTIAVLQRAEPQLQQLLAQAGGQAEDHREVFYWAQQACTLQAAAAAIADRYLSWRAILSEQTENDWTGGRSSAQALYRQALEQAPSLQALADGEAPVWALLRDGIAQPAEQSAGLQPWLVRLQQALDRAKWLAGEMLALLQRSRERLHTLSESMQMQFLYNERRRLFTIGFNVSENRQDRNFYDLLESEARLGSLVAIARNDVPVEHWFAMNRAYGTVGGNPTLLSWNGTMFEYLMPQLLQKSFPYTLLTQASCAAVDAQIAFGRRHGIPWGISECAFADLDQEKNYQYRAFGVPELGLKRDLSERTVIAPYATLMALEVRPQESIDNLKHLAGLGLQWHYGYYESFDYHRQPTAEAATATIVRTYMAHHQGMSFLALTNFLHDDCLQTLFHADARVRAIEPLLHERIPLRPPMHHITTRERATAIAITAEFAPAVRQFDTPHTDIPRVQLLSNGRYQLMVTAAGGGYSRWKQFDLTRWRADVTADPWGIFCYIRDTDSGRLWCSAYQPTAGHSESYSAHFTLGSAVFRRIEQDIESKAEVIVPPEDDVEIRRLTLFNRSDRIRRLDLTSYIELALAPHNADRQHPAFNKLFVQTAALADPGVLLAWRRPRSHTDPMIVAGHRITLEAEPAAPAHAALQFETDRRRFIGRGATLARPMGAWQPPGGSQGYVLDPIFSLRRQITLAPGQRARLALILGAGDSRDQVLALMNRYSDSRAIGRAADYAWSAAQLELRLLHIQPDEARRFQQLAAHLIYPNRKLRPPGQRIAENRRGQSGLWAYAISGDLPIALVIIGKSDDLSLVRQALQAHSYWRMRGLVVDLVIVNEESSGYAEPLREEIERLIHFHGASTGVNTPGGIFLLSADKLSSEDRTLLRAVAAVVLVAGRGSLAQQLAAPTVESIRSAADTRASPAPATLTARAGLNVAPVRYDRPGDTVTPLPFLELHYFNSLGGFSRDGREYAIYLGPRMSTPAPWVNVIANPEFGTLTSETGAGFTWQGNSQRNRLTEWSNDPVTDPAAEAMYLRDEESMQVWSPTVAPIREESAYRARHGTGYTVFEHNSHGIEQELTVFVPLDETGGAPMKLQRLTLRNTSGRPRKLSLTYYVGWTLGEHRETSNMHVVSTWDEAAQILQARNYYHPDYPDHVAFVALSTPVDSYTADRTAFIGRNRSLHNPVSLEQDRLQPADGAGLDPCAALRSRVLLAPGQRIEVTVMLGQARSVQQMLELVRTYRQKGVAERALRQTQAWWDRRLTVLQVKTPELATDLLVNRWLLYQSLSCRLWARSGFYQSGGAFGFRDQLQDVLSLVYADPALAREHILRAASRQFKEGDVQHWWHPPGGTGIRSRISDDLLWLPYVTAQYLRVTGDAAILDETVAFLEAPRLTADQEESYQIPGQSPERATLFEHCQRAVQCSRRYGEHGLPLMGTGDWNDGMNRVGVGGRGESVWLGWFRADVLQSMSDMAELRGRADLRDTYRQERADLIARIEQSAWDGQWYRRAYFDDGSPLGSRQNVEGRIDSLSQSWAQLSGAGNADRVGQALGAAWHRLVREPDRLVLLLEPPFDRAEPSPGYIQGYPPGVRENGGQYSHAAVWLAMAYARRGEGSRAAQLLRLLNPIETAREPDPVWRYGIEPYVIAGDVYSLAGCVGQGGWSWYTGSAAWLYRAWIEEILGFQLRHRRLRIAPAIPSWWDGFQIDYRFGATQYDIQVENPTHCEQGVAWRELDGRRIDGDWLDLVDDRRSHRVTVRMGDAAAAVRTPVAAGQRLSQTAGAAAKQTPRA